MGEGFEWEALPNEVQETILNVMVVAKTCSLSSMQAALSLAACSKVNMCKLMSACEDVFLPLQVTSCTTSCHSWRIVTDSGGNCPYNVAFRVRWLGFGQRWPHYCRPPLCMQLLVVTKGYPWNTAQAYGVNGIASAMRGDGGVLHGEPACAVKGKIVMRRCSYSGWPNDRSKCRVEQMVVESEALSAFFAK